MTLRETEWLLDNGLGVLVLGLLPVVFGFWAWRKWRKDPLKLNQVAADWPLPEAHRRAFVFSFASAGISGFSGIFMQLIGESVLRDLDRAVLNWRKIEFVDAPMFLKVDAATGYLADRLALLYMAAGFVGAVVTIAVFVLYAIRCRQLGHRGSDATEAA